MVSLNSDGIPFADAIALANAIMARAIIVVSARFDFIDLLAFYLSLPLIRATSLMSGRRLDKS
jgi:hypothetical protein